MHLGASQRQASNRTQVVFELTSRCALLSPMTAVVHTRGQLIHQEFAVDDKTLDSEHAHIVDIAENPFGKILDLFG